MDFIKEAERIIEKLHEGKMLLVDYERDPISYIDKNTILFIRPQYDGVKFYGYNVILINEYGLEILIETYDDSDDITGRELAENVIDSIRKGLECGATYYIVPEN